MSSRLSNDFPMPQRDNRAGRAILICQAFNTRFCWRLYGVVALAALIFALLFLPPQLAQRWG